MSIEVFVSELQTLLHAGYRYAIALTGDAADAEDLLQDAWLGMLRADAPRTRRYLFRTIKNRYIDAYRRRQVLDFEPLPDQLTAPPTSSLADRDTLLRGLATLRPEEREALYLCAVEGHTAAEAGALLDRPRNTILSLVHRGRARLRAWLGATQKEALP
jgi:RNA polymerase sigma-70 factor (ECF subfamily)